MNHIVIAGHLGNDPEARFTPSGQKVVSFRVACNTRKGANVETTWFRVTVWGTQFDNMIKHLKKGSPAMVMGELSKPEIFTDKEGRPQISLNITAQSLSFSPFGKAEKPAQAGGFEQTATGHDDFNASSDANYSYYDQAAKGQGVSHAFSEEEVPF